jgi:hypothetical protein
MRNRLGLQQIHCSPSARGNTDRPLGGRETASARESIETVVVGSKLGAV